MKTGKLLILILILAAFLRLWRLASIPPGLTPDEAALGYNAFSVLHTGRDEFGVKLPLIFKSFGDYKPGLYIYLDQPFVAVMGISEWSTRFPSALSGVFSVYLIYLILKYLFTEKGKAFPLVVALTAAVNPWLIYFSRGAWEANLSLMFTLLGILFFIRSKHIKWYLILSTLFFGLTLLTYQGAKLSSLVVVVVLIMVFWKEVWGIGNKYILYAILVGAIVVAPIAITFFNGEVQRLTIFSIFSYRRPESEISSILVEGDKSIKSWNFILFHSENLNYLRAILGRYFNNFSERFLFFEGDWANPISTAPYQGVMLIIDSILLPIGFFAFFKKNLTKGATFFLLWLILAPLSASLSRDEVNAVRDLNLAVPLVFISSEGLYSLIDWIKTKKMYLVYLSIFGVFYLFSLIYFLDAYFVHLSPHNSVYFRYGYKQAFQYIFPIQKKYKEIVFEQSFNQPYIYYLYYKAMEGLSGFDLRNYQSQEHLVSSQYVGDVGFETKIDNISFQNIDWEVVKKEHGVLIIVSPTSLPPGFEKDSVIKDEVKYLDGKTVAFDILEIK